MITVVDYGMGNLRSVRRAFETLGCEVTITSDPQRIREATLLVLPGVGAFGEAVRSIDALNLRGPILDHAREGKPLLGICLGMQLLFESSEESSGAQGLAIIPGEVKRFSTHLKVPHIGWNDVVSCDASIPASNGCYYFVHSYYAQSEFAVGRTEYGISFSSVVRKGNTFGTQFHPEKSQDAGLRFLQSVVARSNR